MSASVGFFNLDENDPSLIYDQIIMNRPNDETVAKQTATNGTSSQSSWIMKCVKMTLLLVVVVAIVFALGWLWLSNHKANSFNSSSIGMLNGQVKMDEQSCEGWIVYKDEKCFKILDEILLTFDDAVDSCAQLESGKAFLPIIRSTEEQTFLTNQLFVIAKKVESFWIGAKFDASENVFRWIDQTDLNYTNWNSAKGPKSRLDYCVQMQAEEDALGKWISVPCGKKSAVVCQKMQTWSMARMQETHLVVRKELTDTKKKIEDLESNLEETTRRKNIKISSDPESDLDRANIRKALEDANRKIANLERNFEEVNRKIKKSNDLECNLTETNAKINKKIRDLESNLEEAYRKIKKSNDLERNLTETNVRINKKISDLERNLEEANLRNSKKFGDLESNLDATNHRKEMEHTNKKIRDLERNLDEANSRTYRNVVPIGFIYVQVPNEKAPVEIWPRMSWTDVSSAYAGVFFRVTGGGAAEFGHFQEENCPRITHFTTFFDGSQVRMVDKARHYYKITEKERLSSYYLNGIGFDVNTGEVRPRNMAIRIWKRTS